MHINFVEIQNFRKLKSCRVELANQTTLFVGANNSGKTSAMVALVKFLIGKNDFTTIDFTLSNWTEINKIGANWEMDHAETDVPAFSINEWEKFLPSMDVWLQIEDNEIHYVTHLLPTLDWEGGLLGVRLRLEPKNIEDFYKDYRVSSKSAKETIAAAKSAQGIESFSLELWPRTMRDFLDKEIRTHFTVRAYTLDPSKCLPPEKGVAKPQELSPISEFIDGDPFKGLILIHNINAQRGFSDPNNKTDPSEDNQSNNRTVGTLSSQLRTYYDKHLNPTVLPDPSDIGALQSIELAQESFDKKLREGFKNALSELGSLGYPGFSDPRITISTKIKPIDSLDHNSAVQFELLSEDNETNNMPLRLPEQYNGLGYQNLISMVFKLMRFRDEWMQVGKVAKKVSSEKNDFFLPPLHLVLVEEPEAHLHVQVQQVFINKAYEILCNHENLKAQSVLTTQLVVSTHSGHIAHEVNFAHLRYFRRKPAKTHTEVPTSTVVNLSEVFGTEDETERFVTRYLESTHCELFFADAAILVEGPAERMLVPHFIRHHFKKLNESYVSLLEIGGNHAHRFKPLIEHLGLTSLIITDLDSADPNKNYTAIQPRRNQGFKTGNSTLKTWTPCKEMIDELLDVECFDKVKTYDDSFSVRVAYQCPVNVNLKDEDAEEEALSNTFEDALVFDNLALFKDLNGNGLIKKFKVAINEKQTVSELGEEFFNALRSAKKAEFALELLFLQDPKVLKVPTYINEGLSWLQEQLLRKQRDILPQSTKPSEAVEVESAVCPK
jgi:predicted ATP-dependent endonuclease of OLD family